jgi:hypothetical protein
MMRSPSYDLNQVLHAPTNVKKYEAELHVRRRQDNKQRIRTNHIQNDVPLLSTDVRLLHGATHELVGNTLADTK